jgi:hypothetical protein
VEELTKRVWIIPAVIVLLTLSGVLGARMISIPTLTFTYDETAKGETAHATFVVQGIRCYGTANFLRKHIESVPGLVSIRVYAGKQRADIHYLPDRTSPEQIISSIENPVMTKIGPTRFYKVVSWKEK